ncbi:hypothetical protein EXU57_23145 [Segetibacter sp. 3557_3]|uniref:hypothetical protein n=1 Tax=Segetibacter sp. 3557_3 TaxID=2547429 RepID=UPI001058A778|nr:hypothetical protein [Segetibacter sp. 3557_3]TDH18496.1 hypothetical protein EXU57_23145 [Segetibacter sp. 3557_3]
MLVILNKQMEVFKAHALKNFEEEMVEHIREFFPNHFKAIQEKGIRNTIEYGYLKARKYGLSTKRNVCLYINNMMLLGSNYETDPLYPSIRLILNDETEEHPNYRVDKLCEKVLDITHQIMGRQNVFLIRALLNILSNSDTLLETVMNGRTSGPLYYLNQVFPQKYAAVGEPDLLKMIGIGTRNARRYGITSQPNLLIYFVCMFMLGSGFDRDPKYAWAGKILNDPGSSDQSEKVEALYNSAINNLRTALSINI